MNDGQEERMSVSCMGTQQTITGAHVAQEDVRGPLLNVMTHSETATSELAQNDERIAASI